MSPLYVGAAIAAACLVLYAEKQLRRGTPAIRVAALAAAGCTAYSADTSWRFAADYLDMAGTAERAAMFGAAELALFATALMARQNLNGPNAAPGVPGLLVWAITSVQVIPAYAESGPVGGTVRAFVGPVMAAMLWHLAMGIELRHRKPDAASRGFGALLVRELRERLLSRLGIAERHRDAAQITRDRATVRAVALAARLAETSPADRGKRRGRRITRRLSTAVARASVGDDREQRRKLLGQLAARRNAAALAVIDLPSPWAELPRAPAASALAGQVRDEMTRATATIRSYPRLLSTDLPPVDDTARSPEQPRLKLSTADALAAIEAGWAEGLTVRETARRATRAPSYVHSVFVRLDTERGPRPVNGSR
ncbi:hypothetical protein SAMN05216499_10156 [Actinacidiphila paucisporea]|uniref:Uncharacterized protein n=1 Tax=Actinacidiphila paucisporea TaxID=310782 RepID=A0A1M6TIE1_9ACTN|nr:hypothetical protein [Actinacidiphila paucisporea]SHK56731.1 hypothetical protein SAMN05216499_10156 [Actinacidiphila paucisporea]